ncbi:stearoyl-CoA desaturase (delta-9 desaturase) [Haloferula luteola]|uniref:Stearoyl-CoA desaturase (Delta-9 desaturase) n=1 Tax=Haloferula luteola TaxID=595692 RepID=A0A840VBD5_9BACT|nr:fatty acid desaturase [Haloferula luteola]MBB5351119.1 stearoyl-CoA desaturase (delta-9 desaturase) [Haloferula luteola]
MPLRVPYKRVDWLNTVFLLAVTLVALIAAPYFIWKNGINGFQLAMFTFYSLATGMSITLGYHRLFSHLSFKAKWPVRLFTLVFGACAFENSVLNWASDHRRHHKHVDHDDDPYNIQNGFLWAHIGWILFKVLPEPPLDNVADLRKDRLVMWQHRNDKMIALLVGLGLPALLGYWNGGAEGALGGFLIAGALRVFVVQQCTFFINSLCHTIGRQPYSSKNSARDSTIMAFFTFGEGYHNFHHSFQHDYRNGVKAWNFDPTKWAIWALSRVGLVSDLRRVPEEKIILAEIAEARRRAEEQLAQLSETGVTVCEKALATVHELQESLAAAYHELEQAVAQRAEMSRQALNRWRRDARQLIAALSDLTPLPA